MRRAIWIGTAAVVAAVGLGAAVYLFTPATGPARDLGLAADPERGEYLLRLAGCVACHTDTAGEGAFLAGGAALETDFGSFYAPNITSHPQAGIGSWTLEQFSRALSDGVGPYGEHYYPAFPYDSYTLLIDQDVVDLYAALMVVPAVGEAAPDHQLGFPFNMRIAMAAWKTLFFEPGRFVPDPDRSDLWNRGAYIVNGPAHCGACHTPRNALGAPETGRALAGGDAPPITPEALAEFGYDPEWLAEVLQGGVTPQFDVPGGSMYEVIHEGTIYWTDDDIAAAVAYLMDLDAID